MDKMNTFPMVRMQLPREEIPCFGGQGIKPKSPRNQKKTQQAKPKMISTKHQIECI